QSALDIPDDRVLHQIAVTPEILPTSFRHLPGAQSLKNLVGIVEIRGGRIDRAAEIAKHGASLFADGDDFGLYGITAKIGSPSDARSFEIALERLSELRTRFFDGNRGTMIWAGYDGKEKGDIANAARHRTFDRQCIPSQYGWPARHTAGRWAKSDNIA